LKIGKTRCLRPLVTRMTTHIDDLKDLIGEVIVTKDTEPEYFVGLRGKKTPVYHDLYYCPVSRANVPTGDICYILEGYALNEHIVCYNQHPRFNLKKVACITIRDTIKKNYYTFIFNIQDRRKHYTEACTILGYQLPKELVDLVALYLGSSRPKNTYTASDFPFNFQSEYKGQLPTVISREQLKMLYKLGFVKLVDPDMISSYTALTDESYDHVYPNNAQNRLNILFRTKEDMHTYVENALKLLSFV
jgi:hypothetical protein